MNDKTIFILKMVGAGLSLGGTVVTALVEWKAPPSKIVEAVKIVFGKK